MLNLHVELACWIIHNNEIKRHQNLITNTNLKQTTASVLHGPVHSLHTQVKHYVRRLPRFSKIKILVPNISWFLSDPCKHHYTYINWFWAFTVCVFLRQTKGYRDTSFPYSLLNLSVLAHILQNWSDKFI